MIGFEAVNDFDSITISDSHRVLVFAERGTFIATSSNSNTPGYATVTFGRPLTTPAVPELFIRLIDANRASVECYFRFLGGPGNWTGFVMTFAASSAGNLMRHTLEYVLCKFSDSPAISDYGMEFYDASGNGAVTFNSDDKIVRFNRFTKQWVFLSAADIVMRYTSGIQMELDEFIGVASFDRGPVFFRGDYVGLSLMQNNVRTLGMLINYATPNYSNRGPGGITYFNFSMPICRFPADRY